ncbi:MAG TPA: hypothetical protein VF514_16305, partial [Bacteroidota bacterium]
RDAFVGFIAGLGAMAVVILFTTIDYTWHTLIGCAVTIIFGNLSARMFHFNRGTNWFGGADI